LLPAYLHDTSAAAWEPTEEALTELRRQLLEPEDSSRLESQLRAVGLTGAPLQYKYSGFDTNRRRERPRDPGLLRPWFSRAFGWADAIRGSLAVVLPAAEVVEELKEASEQGAADVEG